MTSIISRSAFSYQHSKQHTYLYYVMYDVIYLHMYVVTLCVGRSKAFAGHYLDITQEQGQYPDIAWDPDGAWT